MRDMTEMTEGADLHECPFCGGTAFIHELDPQDYVVQCLDCGACGPIVTTIMDDPIPALRQAWNRRFYRIPYGESA